MGGHLSFPLGLNEVRAGISTMSLYCLVTLKCLVSSSGRSALLPNVGPRRIVAGLAIALALAACTTPARFPQIDAIEVRAGEVKRDLEAFDQVAVDVGFSVNERDHRVEGLTYFRYYQSPTRCCLGIGLAMREQDPVWEFWASDPYAGVREFRTPECAKFARFREALIAKVGRARIVQERPLPGCE